MQKKKKEKRKDNVLAVHYNIITKGKCLFKILRLCNIDYIIKTKNHSTYIKPCVCVCMPSRVQSCPTLCDPLDYSSAGSSVHGILQARILEWAAM